MAIKNILKIAKISGFSMVPVNANGRNRMAA
jgi:hypothetical protein